MTNPTQAEARRRAERDLAAARDSDLWERAVEWVREIFTEPALERIRQEQADDPDGWCLPHHMTLGMGFRNAMRDAGFGERAFGIENLDNIYVEVLEDAAGIEEGDG